MMVLFYSKKFPKNERIRNEKIKEELEEWGGENKMSFIDLIIEENKNKRRKI